MIFDISACIVARQTVVSHRTCKRYGGQGTGHALGIRRRARTTRPA